MANKPNVRRTAVQRRLRYLSDYLFGGDVAAFEQRLQCYRRRLEYVLSGRATPQPDLLTAIVVELNVSPAWLLTGRQPVFLTPPPSDATCAVSPYPLFNPAAMDVVETGFQLPVQQIDAATLESLARAVYAAKINRAPVLLLYDQDALSPACFLAVQAFLRRNWVTALATTTAAAYKELAATVVAPADVVLWAASAGFGFGYAAGRWLPDKETVLGSAYAHNVPLAVQISLGHAIHFEFGAGPTHYGAALGAAGYVDLLLLAEQVQQLLVKPESLCISVTNDAGLLTAVQNAAAAASRTTDFRLGQILIMSSRLLPDALQRCRRVIEGKVHADSRDIRRR